MRSKNAVAPAANGSAGRVWTEEQVRELGVRTDGVTACSIAYGDGRTKAFERLRSGDVDFRVLKRGRSYIVPVADLLKLLGLDDSPNAA